MKTTGFTTVLVAVLAAGFLHAQNPAGDLIEPVAPPPSVPVADLMPDGSTVSTPGAAMTEEEPSDTPPPADNPAAPETPAAPDAGGLHHQGCRTQ